MSRSGTGDDPARVAEVFSLFEELCDLSSKERRDRLRALEDTVLRREVEAMLSMDAEPQLPLDAPGGAPQLLGAQKCPERVGEFEILAELGRGGMGVVYEALQATPRRTVALKIIHPGFITPELFKRFRQEAEALGSLNHPGIAQVYAAGSAPAAGGEQPYIAMELVRGEPIDRYVHQAALGLHGILELVAKLCDGMHHAHQRGVVHRDLKPSNVLVTRDGTPKVLDFGVARIEEAAGVAAERTRTGQLVGTLAYMSPEQVRTDLGPIDGRTDVYALGVMAYELLTGSRPLELDSRSLPEAARVIVEEDALPLGRIDGRLRGDVEILVATAIAKESKRRYASAAAFASDIRRFLSNEPIQARSASRTYLLGKFTRRNKAVVAGVAATFLAMAVGTGIALWQAGNARRAGRTLEKQRRVAQIEAYRGTLAAAQSGLELGRMSDTAQALERVPQDQRGWEWSYLWQRLDQADALLDDGNADVAAFSATNDSEPTQLVIASLAGSVRFVDPYLGEVARNESLDVGPLKDLALSSDGRWLGAIFGPESRQLGVWDLDKDGRLVHAWSARFQEAVGHVALSEHGGTVAVSGQNRAWVFIGNDPEPIRWEHGASPRGIALSGHGTHLALVGTERGTGVYRVFDVALQSATPALARDVNSLALSPDGRFVASSEADGVIRLREARTGRILQRSQASYGTARFAVFDSFGQRLAVGGGAGTVHVWNLDSTELLNQAPHASPYPLYRAATLALGHAVSIQSIAFGSTGTKLVTVDAAGAVKVSGAITAQGPRSLSGHVAGIIEVAVSPSDSRIVSASRDGTLCFWNGATSEAYASLRVETEGCSALEISPDGTLLAMANRGEVQLRELVNPLEMQRLVVGSENVLALSFAGDGRIATFDAGGDLLVWSADLETRISETSLYEPAQEGGAVGTLEAADLAFSPSGVLLAVAAQDCLTVLYPSTGQRVQSLCIAEAQPLSVAWLPAQETLVSGWSDGVIRIVDPGSRSSAMREMRSVHGPILSLAPFTDGSRIACGLKDGVIEIWDMETERLTLELREHTRPVTSLAFSLEGLELVSNSENNLIVVFDTRPRHERQRAAAQQAVLTEQARSLVMEHVAVTQESERIAERLWRDASLTEEQREAALRWTLDVPVPDHGVEGDPLDGFALSLTGGNAHLLVQGEEESLRMGAASTIELWVRPRALQAASAPESAQFQTILNKEGEYQIALNSEGALRWLFAGPEGWMPHWVPVAHTLRRDRWVHLAVVRDRQDVRFHVNGRLAQVWLGPERLGDHHPEMNELRIGGRQHTASGFVGEIDEVRLWSVARTEQEILGAMRISPSTDESGLLAAWSFDEGQGSAAADLKGAHPGKLVGATWCAVRRQDNSATVSPGQ